MYIREARCKGTVMVDIRVYLWRNDQVREECLETLRGEEKAKWHDCKLDGVES